MVHRGPDDESSLIEPGVALGARRLSVVDVKGGSQPLWSEDGEIAVFMNGEIYNYVELRTALIKDGHVFRTKSDTEVVAHLYEACGADLCRELRGMFALAVWDRRRRRLLLARDRFGKKPLYWSRGSEGVLVFASELNAVRPLLRAAGVMETISALSVWDYLSTGAVPQPATIWEGVSAVEPATVICWEGGRIASATRYWEPCFEPKLTLSYEEAKEELRSRVNESVRLRLRSDVPVGLFLSGGMDSGAIAAELAALGAGNISSYTVSTSDANLDETSLATQTAQRTGLQNEVLPLSIVPLQDVQFVAAHWGQPFADSSAIPTLAVARLARKHVTVVLNGDGGDEVLGGYRRYVAARGLDRLGPVGSSSALRLLGSLLPQPKLRRSALAFGYRWARGLGISAGRRYLIWTTDLFRDEEKRHFWQREKLRPTEDLYGSQIRALESEVDKLTSMDLSFNLLSGLLVKMDVATMAASVEARSPFLDHKLAEFCFRLPVGFRVSRGRGKAILRDTYRSILPKAVTTATKRGFEIPLDAWLKGALAPMVHEFLLGRDSRTAEWVERGFMDTLVNSPKYHDGNWAARLYCLLILELWLRQSSEA
jgi:asparagine synthase (glutamine-hydrolysing)